jgi:hypothetical protein
MILLQLLAWPLQWESVMLSVLVTLSAEAESAVG